MSNNIRIIEARSTIYFIKEDNRLLHGYDLTLLNKGQLTSCVPSAKWGVERFECQQMEVPEGSADVRVFIPDIRDNIQLTFELDGSELSIMHTPQRHWKVHVIQFAHHDLGYTGLPTSVLREMTGFLDDALEFCNQTDDYPEDSKFRYNIEQGWSLLYWMEHRSDGAKAEMIRRIREGRMEVNALIGNQITELHGPEEMARSLYPVFALKREYDIPVVSAEHNDIPGISWGVTAALSAAGVRYFSPALPDYFRWGPQYRTFWDEDEIVPGGRPHAFWWEAPDGEKILFWYGTQGAGGPIDTGLKGLPNDLIKLEQTDYPYDVLRYQVRGGDRDNSNTRIGFAKTCREWNEKWVYPHLISSLNSRFFTELEKQLHPDTRVFSGELPATDYSAAANCTAYPSSINRVAHDQLLAAERIASVASLAAKQPYPAERLKEAYHCTLMNDEHCWGLAYPGGPGQDACLAQHCEFGYRAAALAHDVLNKSLYGLADHIQVKDDGYHAVVFNPLSWSRSDIATAPVWPVQPCDSHLQPAPGGPQDPNDPETLIYNYPVSNHGMPGIPMELIRDGLRVIDVETGETMHHEVVELFGPDAPVPYAGYRYNMGALSPHARFEVRFQTKDVPPLGYRLYRFEPAPAAEKKVHTNADTKKLENDFYRLEVDGESGAVKSLFDKEIGLELIDGDAEFGGNQVVLRSSLTSERESTSAVTIEAGDSGPLTSSIVVRTQARGYPQIVQQITLYHTCKRVDFATRMLKDATGHLETFIAFPFDISRPNFRYEGSLCSIEPFVDQFPGSNTDYYAIQHWANVSDESASVTLCSLEAPMMQFGDNWPLYISQAHHGVTPPNFDHPFHGPESVEKGHLYSFVLLNNYRTNFSPYQTGDVLFRFSMTSHKPDPTFRTSRDFGYGVSIPLAHASIDRKQDDGLSVVESWISIDQPNLLLLTLKKAEDGNGLIVRLLETEGRDTTATVTIPGFPVSRVIITNLVEEDVGPARVQNGMVEVFVKAKAIATVRIIM